MKLTLENIKDLEGISKYDKRVLISSLDDIEEINRVFNKELYIDRQDYHDEYSAERTDPCPDYYNYFTVRNAKNGEAIGPFCEKICELEDVILTIWDIVNLNEFSIKKIVDKRLDYNLKILDKLKYIVINHPYLRFGQILFNLQLNRDLFNEEPTETYKKIIDITDNLKI